MNAAEKIVEWRLIQEEVARHMTTAALEGFLWAEGILIPEGISALVLVNGKVEHRVGPGMYRFQGQRAPQITGAAESVRRFFTDLFFRSSEPNFTAEIKQAAERKIGLYAKDVTSISVWLFRDSAFRASVKLAPKRGGDGLDVDLLLQIKDPHSLIRLSPGDFASPSPTGTPSNEPPVLRALEGITTNEIRNLLQSRLGDRMYEVLFSSMDRGIREQERLFREEWSPFISQTGLEIISLIGLASESQSGVREKVKELEQRREEFSVLTHLWKAQNQLARGDLLNQDERNAIRHEVQKIGLLRESEMANFRAEILKQEGERNHQREVQGLLMGDAISKLQAKLAAAEKEAALRLREDLETREERLEIAKQRIRQYGLADDKIEDTRKQNKLQDEEKRMEDEREHTRKANKVERFKTIVELRSKIDDSKANKTVKEAGAYAKMTPEQIVAANPNLTQHGAKAMEEKFKAEAAQNNSKEMKEFLEKQAQVIADMAKNMAGSVRGEDARVEKRTKTRVDQVAKMAQKVKHPDPKGSSSKDASDKDSIESDDREEEES